MGSVFKRGVHTRSRRDARSATYCIKFRDGSGRWVRESAHTTSLDAAKTLLREREEAVNRGTLSKTGTAKFGEVAERWLNEHSKIRLRSWADDEIRYRKHLSEPFGLLRLRDINPAAISALVNGKIQGGLSVATARRIAGLLRRILNFAVAEGLLGESPFRRLRRGALPPEPKYLDPDWFTEEELAKILDAAPPKERPFYATAMHTGMRLGELSGLRWSDVDLDARQITVARSWTNATTKGGVARHLPIGAALYPVLVAWKANCPPTEGGLSFPAPRARRNESGGPLGYGMRDARSTLETFQRLCRNAGVRALRFHDLRHSFATHYMKQGGNLYNLKAILGHSTITLTERYAHHAPEFMRADVDRLRFEARPTGVVGIEDARRSRQPEAGGGREGRGEAGDAAGAIAARAEGVGERDAGVDEEADAAGAILGATTSGGRKQAV